MDEEEQSRHRNFQISLQQIIYPEIEPGIITTAMIEKAYKYDGKKGERGRLHQMQPVQFDRIKILRLEQKNILRIDHLWIVPNLTKLSLSFNKIETIESLELLVSLKELDLSFNYIEKIENLDTLVNLETLSLFHNCIKKIENLDALENLVILSIGANQIDTLVGIERFRFFKKLSVLNLEGNPIAQNPEWPLAEYIAAILPDLQYYEYISIDPKKREKAKERFKYEIREIEAEEEKELIDRAAKAKELLDIERLSSSFVEHLNGHQLFQSLWKNDEDGAALLQIGFQAQDLKEEYDNDMFEITQEIYKLGLERYEEREVEINDFMENLEEGQIEIQELGQKLIERFLAEKDKILEEAAPIIKNLEIRTMNGEDEDSPESLQLSDKLDRMQLEYEDSINELWQKLMCQELHLHEAIEESTVNFQRKIQEMMSKFIEQVQGYFAKLRDVCIHFSENLTELVSHFISTKLATQEFDDVPPELRHCLDDREALGNLVASMKDTHVQRIDEREDRMMVRSREFIEEKINKLNDEEMVRNRAKILEISTFLEIMGEAIINLQAEIREELINEDS